MLALAAFTLGCFGSTESPPPGKLTTRTLLILRENSYNLAWGPTVVVLLQVDVAGGVLTETPTCRHR